MDTNVTIFITTLLIAGLMLIAGFGVGAGQKVLIFFGAIFSGVVLVQGYVVHFPWAPIFHVVVGGICYRIGERQGKMYVPPPHEEDDDDDSEEDEPYDPDEIARTRDRHDGLGEGFETDDDNFDVR